MSRRVELHQRREVLLARSERLRTALLVEGTALRERFAMVDSAVGLARSVTQRPVLVAAAAAVLMLLKPARALRYLARGAVVVSLVRRLLGWLDRQPR
ncbi:MAG: YqjK family protein [Gammaproteobacteria bacterium]